MARTAVDREDRVRVPTLVPGRMQNGTTSEVAQKAERRAIPEALVRLQPIEYQGLGRPLSALMVAVV